jgi:serpin B
MMSKQVIGHAKYLDFSFLKIPYRGGELQFLVLLPDKPEGLPALEQTLTARVLAGSAALKDQEVILHLPKFKLEPKALALSRTLQTLGMKSAFNQPPGSANFDRMSPRHPDDYLYISEVFHKTFLSLDEK